VKSKSAHDSKPVIPLIAMVKASFMLGDEVVLSRTTWRWKPAEQWAILGPNGGGKSLFIQALQGRLQKACGDVSYGFELESSDGRAAGEELFPETAIVEVSQRSQRELARQVSGFYQARWYGSELKEGLTVDDYLSQTSVENILPCEVDGCHSDPLAFNRARRRYVKWLNFTPLLHRKLSYLSNGEQRKLLLIHALLKFPRLLVLDDPYGGLDAATRTVLSETIQQLMGSGARVLVAVSRPEELPSAVTHVLLIHRKRIVAQGLKEEILNLERTRRLFVNDKSLTRSGAKIPCKEKTPKRSKTNRSRASSPIIEMRQIHIEGRGKVILDGIDWIVKSGERWALTGHNGAGKTTLLSIIQGDHPQVYAQDIRFFGAAVNSTQSLWKTRMQMGWMSPELNLHYPADWPCLEVVCSGFFNSIGLYHGCSAAQRSTARRWLKTMGLSDLEGMAFGGLSTGMQRLVLLCRAVVKTPRLLVLDEPCQGVDSRHSNMILGAVDRLVAQTGAALIFVTHHHGELPGCITHSMTLEKGRVYRQA
jgi:molybdate transport system ATP-binding protein